MSAGKLTLFFANRLLCHKEGCSQMIDSTLATFFHKIRNFSFWVRNDSEIKAIT